MRLSSLYEAIPETELEKLEEHIRTYRPGDTILREGEPSSRSLYVLRHGKVGVYRQVPGRGEEFLNEIEAINFLGEIEMICGGRVLSTVRALTDVVIYHFPHFDITAILNNPEWVEKLFTRLTWYLKTHSDRLITLEAENARLQAKLKELEQAAA